MTTTILLPTLNEEKSIGETIKEIKINFSTVCPIVVVDSQSQDRTVEIAKSLGAVIISTPKRGKGTAIREAIEILRTSVIKTDYYVMMDSDFTYPAEYVRHIYRELEHGADVVMGYRAGREEGAMSGINVVGNRALSVLAGILYQKRVKDLCTGFWGFRRGVLESFRLTSSGFTLEADLFGNAMKAGCKVKQIPIFYRARLEGSKTKLKVKHGVEIAWFLVRNRWK